MSLVFLDLETTGLDPTKHGVWEMAWAVDNGPVISGVVNPGPCNVDPEASAVNGYNERYNRDRVLTLDSNLRSALNGHTVVAANPAFDTAFLSARWGLRGGDAPWRYRLWDIEAYAAGVLDLPALVGLGSICQTLGLPPGDHTAAGDVRALRAAFLELRRIASHNRRRSLA